MTNSGDVGGAARVVFVQAVDDNVGGGGAEVRTRSLIRELSHHVDVREIVVHSSPGEGLATRTLARGRRIAASLATRTPPRFTQALARRPPSGLPAAYGAADLIVACTLW